MNTDQMAKCMCRTPQGVRGLKFKALGIDEDKIDESHPARGAWIEMIDL